MEVFLSNLSKSTKCISTRFFSFYFLQLKVFLLCRMLYLAYLVRQNSKPFDTIFVILKHAKCVKLISNGDIAGLDYTIFACAMLFFKWESVARSRPSSTTLGKLMVRIFKIIKDSLLKIKQ